MSPSTQDSPKVPEGGWEKVTLYRRHRTNPARLPDLEYEDFVPVSALLSDELVERVAAALHDEQERRDPTGPPPDGWCPPGHDVHQEPPREPSLWAEMVAEGKYPGTQDEFRKDARAALQAVVEQVGGGQGA